VTWLGGDTGLLVRMCDGCVMGVCVGLKHPHASLKKGGGGGA